MNTSSFVVNTAGQLAAAGRHAEGVQYVGARPAAELESTPGLALLYGTAQARLGRHDEGLRWLDMAVDQARKDGEREVEGRALNARGAMALVSGRIDESADYCTRALMVASVDGDLATVGRCSNNLGIINNLRGRHAEALGSWELAVAAFEKAGVHQGVAECAHNLAITYREQGTLDPALTEAEKAIAEANAAGDRTLAAMALRGRAGVRLARGEAEVARSGISAVQEIRRLVPNPVGEAEDLRVVAAVLAAGGQLAAGEEMLRGVIGRAEAHQRPQLVAEATRHLSLRPPPSARLGARRTAPP